MKTRITTNMNSSMAKRMFGMDCDSFGVIIRCLLKELVKLVIAELNLTNDKQFAPSKSQVAGFCEWIMNRQMKSAWLVIRRFYSGPPCRTVFRSIVLCVFHS